MPRFVYIPILVLLATGSACAQLDIESEPINYSNSEPSDKIANLVVKLRSGNVELPRDDEHGYLMSLLRELEVPVSSQSLVFSKTSFQRHRINRRTPRAVYFNDEVYVGWVQRGDQIELSVADSVLGAVFYTLDQKQEGSRPKIVRQVDRCITCHASTHTQRVPGHVMRSVYADRSGMPAFGSGTFRTDHTSPLNKRWGGWYVSGTHGSQRHMGNEAIASKLRSDELDVESGANVMDLSRRFKTDPYLTPHSDIIALMVLAHQVAVHNAITAANYAARRTIHDAKVMNKALERSATFESDSTKRRFASAAETLVEWLLMSDEAELTAPVVGTSGFAKQFEARGPFDRSGRSLRQFDMKRRMFRFPCSYLIYSEAFDALPERLLSDVYRQLLSVLRGNSKSGKFAHLSPEDRNAIREILTETKSLPDYWTVGASRAASEAN